MERQSEVLGGCELVWASAEVRLGGEIDSANVSLVEQRVLPLISGPVTVIDCRSVTFLDAGGVRMLARFGAAALSANTVVRVRCSPWMTITLELCGFEELPGLVLTHEEPS
ncbi:STAS domain-containing protein [Actinoplanes sp. NEAU-A12]|uniref:STAS domain-containing protein n=1 Tax=Actinoplanes sandaracinus TaxID=3045177 RepID=A0ABT6X1M8_9ACTN|nr:STAS domain-containing protein [Actinoplanes sandaracinus]MDI6105908.1 STAS domain-containing protein [Actinoplanes sandaracinus]